MSGLGRTLDLDRAIAPAQDDVLSILYRSRHAPDFSEAALAELLARARDANTRVGVTGLLVYGPTEFLQWIEGPHHAVDSLFESLRRDPRHQNVELISRTLGAQRRFRDLAMGLAAEAAFSDVRLLGATPPPTDLRAQLLRERRSSRAPSPWSGGGAQQPPLDAAGDPANQEPTAQSAAPEAGTPEDAALGATPDAAVLDLIADAFARRAPGASAQNADGAWSLVSRALVRLLLDGELSAATRLVWLTSIKSADPLSAQIQILEAAAARLGDLWRGDDCSELDILIATTDMIRIMRKTPKVGRGAWRAASPAVLVAPEPGEGHLLSAVLDAEALRRSGWAPRLAFPLTDRALSDLVASARFDALDLSVSRAFSRDHWAARMAETIEAARSASRNPRLAVTVSGRLFTERADAAAETGADGAVDSAADIAAAINAAMQRAGERSA